KMLSLLDLISQNQPHFQTHQALLVIGLQNDFIQPDGRLPVDTRNGFLERIDSIVPKFRQLSANIIWVKTLYETDRLANDPTTGEGDAIVVGGLVDGAESSTDDDDDLPKDLIPPTQSRSSRRKQRALDLLKRVSARKPPVPRKGGDPNPTSDEDEELFLLRASKNGPACLPNTPGAEFIDSLKPKIEQSDTILPTTNYSAFLGTSLLLILRAKLVTELFICGCITNVSVLATVVDAARHGIKINVIEDCLGFRKRTRHDEALKRMVEFFDANMVTSKEILDRDVRSARSSLARQPSDRASQLTTTSRHRTLSDLSVAESRATTDTKLSDEQFAEKLSQGAKLPKDSYQTAPAAKQNLVKSKIRMRSRTDKSKKEKTEDKAAKAAGTASKAEGSSRTKTGEAAATNAPPVKPTTITKAESSDRLRESPSLNREKSLKSSASHPVLSGAGADANDSRQPSARSAVRLALQRSLKSDSTKTLPADAPQSPSRAAPEPPTTSPSTSKKPPMGKKLKSLANFPVLRPGDRIAEGDSRIIYNFFPPTLKHLTEPSKPLKDVIFHQLYNEVRWQKMLHQTGEVPRLVCCQGSSIVNVSFGAQRTMRLRTKKVAKPATTNGDEEEAHERETQRVAMPHNSMFVLGLDTNKKWLHGIMADKRIEAERSEDETAYSGIRISLTFRHIGTFLDAENSTIWGQGATSKNLSGARDVINDDEEENEKVVRAFGKENHQSDFDWDEHYGDGFDVLHFRDAPEDSPILFASNNITETRMVQIFLAENKLKHTLIEAPALDKAYELDRQVCYRDNDISHTETPISVPILIYLDRYYPLDRDDRGRATNSKSYEIMVMVMGLLKFWMNRHVPTYQSDVVNMIEQLEEKLAMGPGPFIAGRRFSVGDCTTWPILDEIITKWDDWDEEKFPHLTEYYRMLWKKKKSVQKLREKLPELKMVKKSKD
ncbi:isochorismatase family protein, partial [Aaosphaeria arxii CBS 175.79]